MVVTLHNSVNVLHAAELYTYKCIKRYILPQFKKYTSHMVSNADFSFAFFKDVIFF